MDLPIPATIESVTADWLTGALRGSALAEGAVVSAVDHRQIGVGLGVLSLLYRVTPTYEPAGAGPPTVVIKLASQHAETRQVVAGYRFYEREVDFYRDFAARVSITTAHCHHADFDPDGGDFIVVMEDVGGLRAESQLRGCSIDDARIALGHLARHHADWWLNDDLLAFGALQTTAEPPYPDFIAQQTAQAWPRCAEILGDRIPPDLHELGATFASVGSAMMIDGAQRPWTFNHGDFRLDNLFFDEDGGLTVLDWQIGFRTYGANDVGYFLSQSLQPGDRRDHEADLVREYHDALRAGGVDDYGFDELWTDYRRAILFCFTYPMTAAGQLDVSDERALALVTSMMDRSVAAITELDALELRPD
jgi:hypothetical protein